MTRAGIEPLSPGILVNTLLTRPMARLKGIIFMEKYANTMQNTDG